MDHHARLLILYEQHQTDQRNDSLLSTTTPLSTDSLAYTSFADLSLRVFDSLSPRLPPELMQSAIHSPQPCSEPVTPTSAMVAGCLLPHFVLSPVPPPVFSPTAPDQSASRKGTPSTALRPTARVPAGGRQAPLLQQVLRRKQVLRDSNRRDGRLGPSKPSSRLANCVTASPHVPSTTLLQEPPPEVDPVLGSPESECSPIQSTSSSPLYVSMRLREPTSDETKGDWRLSNGSDYDTLGMSGFEDTVAEPQVSRVHAASDWLASRLLVCRPPPR